MFDRIPKKQSPVFSNVKNMARKREWGRLEVWTICPVNTVDELMNGWVEIRTRYDRHQCRTHLVLRQ